MGTFFSGTDTAEIVDNSEFHNFYLSVITNNYLSFVAQIAFRATGVTTLTAKDENGDDYQLGIRNLDNAVYIYQCEVQNRLETLKPSFLESVEAIIEGAKKAAAKLFTSAGTRPAGFVAPTSIKPYQQDNFGKAPERDAIFNTPLFDDIHSQTGQEMIKSVEYIQQMESFTIALLLCDFPTLHNLQTITQAAAFLKTKLGNSKDALSIDSLERGVVTKYNDVYFGMFSEADVSREVYLDDITEVIENLRGYANQFPFLFRVLNGLEGFRKFVAQEEVVR